MILSAFFNGKQFLAFGLCSLFIVGLSTNLMAQGTPGKTQPKTKPGPADLEKIAPIRNKDNENNADGPRMDGYWFLDADKAMETAAKSNKSLIMNFTGSDWCGWCIKLDKEVFSKRDFKKEALKDFVFLKLDFPSDKSKQTPAEIEQNEKLKNKLGVAGFPSIYVCDAQGRPFAKTGYLEGGPEKYLAHLKSFRKKLIERNELFALAARADGDKKAELLDRALSLMDPDIATTHYEDVIKQIVTIDKSNRLGLRQKYYAAQDAEERRRILAKLDVIVNTLESDRALTEFDKAYSEVTLPPNEKIDALQQKLFLLKKLDRTADADKLLDEMASVDGLTENRRERILVQKAFNYVATGRPDDGLSFLDDQIKTHPQSHVLLTTKGEMLDSMGKHQQALEAFDAALPLCDSSEAVANVVALKAYSLVALEKTDAALKLFDEFVDSQQHPDYVKADLLVQKAILLLENGREAAAELAQKQALELAESDEQKREIESILKEFK